MPTLADISALIGAAPPADAAHRGVEITGVATLAEANPGEVSFIGSDAFLKQLVGSRAGALIVQRKVATRHADEIGASGKPLLVVDDADLAVAKVLEHFAPTVPRPPAGVDPAARVESTASLGDGVAVGPNVFVGARSRVGARTVRHSGVYVGEDVTLGADCGLFPNVVVRERIGIGERVVIHAGSVLGSDGFGYRWDGTRHVKVPQIGTVVIEDDVEIGSCVCVDRAKFSTTRVGRGTKIDNLVQVGHNVQIGPHCIITGQVGLAGSVTLGAGVVLGGQSAVRDHVTMGDGSMAAGCAGVAEDVDPKMIVSGLPALPHRQSLREQAALRRLPDLMAQVRKLQEELEQLKRSHT